MKIELYKLYKCKIREDLDISTIKPNAIKNLGKIGMFEAYWKIEYGEYKGQYAMKCDGIPYWYPHKDLIFLEEKLTALQGKTITVNLDGFDGDTTWRCD